jgi:uncharacterized membrane protein
MYLSFQSLITHQKVEINTDGIEALCCASFHIILGVDSFQTVSKERFVHFHALALFNNMNFLNL